MGNSLRTAGLAVVLSLAVAAPIHAQWSASRASSHAPIGVMGDHRHEAGEVMLSYRFMYMYMEGSRIGTDAIDDSDIVSPTGERFMVTPTKMPMMMHMFGAMFAPTDRITLLAMLPVPSSEMDHRTRAGGMFTTASGGIGDVRVGGLIGVTDFGNQTLHANALISLPTGSIEEMDALPTSGGQDVQLPYPMQTGSGTFDLMPGLTWLGQAGTFSWGAQGTATIRLGENDHEYTLGNRFEGTAWGALDLARNWSASLRLLAQRTNDIEGADPAPSVNPDVVPTARTDLRAGTRFDAGLGLNFYLPPANAFRIAVEGLLPLYQDLDGPQLETDWTLTIGLQIVPIR